MTIGVLDSRTSSCDVMYAHIIPCTSWRLLVADIDHPVRASTSTTQARRDVDRKFLHVR
jgi:hypothetical protein